MGRDAIVAGTGFDGRAEIVRKHVRQGMLVQLRRELSNRHDPNAVAVLIEVPKLFGLLGKGWKQIGYIKSDAASHIAAKMDSGLSVTGFVKSFHAPEGGESIRESVFAWNGLIPNVK